MSNYNLRRKFEEARKADFDLTDTLDKPCGIPINELLKNDLEEHLGDYGMHIEYIPKSDFITDLIDEYESCIMSNLSKIRKYLRELCEDVLNEKRL